MGFKHISIQIIIRIILLLLLLVFIAYLITFREVIKAIFTFPILVALIIELYRYLNKSNEDYIKFLNALANKDYTISFHGSNRSKSEANLYQNLEKIGTQFRTLNFDRELQFQHLQRLIQHIDIGIIAFDNEDKIHLVNKSFHDLFELPFIAKNQTLNKINPEFKAVLKNMQKGENKLIKKYSSGQSIELSLNASIYNFKKTNYKLISVKDIHGELDAKEQESFQKLISVLTHEIMNSVSPIVSLSSTLNDSLNNSDSLTNIKKESFKEAINAIHDRSRNLLNFTHEYRKLTKLPKAKLETIEVQNLIQKINKLYQAEFKSKKIQISLKFDHKSQELFADEYLIEQAIINLYKNSIEALTNTLNPRIDISTAILSNQQFCLQIRDNGKGISEEKLGKVFIPFYTDKEEGSGIGLSLCKQIMKLHSGKISIETKMNEFTAINLIFI